MTFCVSCGLEHSPGKHFCYRCGTRLKGALSDDTEVQTIKLSAGGRQSLEKLRKIFAYGKLSAPSSGKVKKTTDPYNLEVGVQILDKNGRPVRRIFPNEKGFILQVNKNSSEEDWIMETQKMFKNIHFETRIPSGCGFVKPEKKLNSEDLKKIKKDRKLHKLRLYLLAVGKEREEIKKAFQPQQEMEDNITVEVKKDDMTTKPVKHKTVVTVSSDEEDFTLIKKKRQSFDKQHIGIVEKAQRSESLESSCKGGIDEQPEKENITDSPATPDSILEETPYPLHETAAIGFKENTAPSTNTTTAIGFQENLAASSNTTTAISFKKNTAASKNTTTAIGFQENTAASSNTTTAIGIQENTAASSNTTTSIGIQENTAASSNTTTAIGFKENIAAGFKVSTDTSLQDEHDYELEKFVRIQAKLEERKNLARKRFTENFVPGKKEITVIYKAFGGHSFTVKTSPGANIQILFDFICGAVDHHKLAAKFHLHDKFGNKYYAASGCLENIPDMLFIEEEDFYLNETITNYDEVFF